ncbi:hypothetical protein [Planctomyces sp. SH-PL62]|uniref:hypothetical protein n=1 Tax=Planctomyces sp. SH-PL62 TaxID=1636152 RepID=UPI00078EB25B|nr:hypothetical protein [Planctomyces sp. SH-PL62]AMV37814.1 hypothetical protein VT85_10280 [Planctomyces sp. SH-PL62]
MPSFNFKFSIAGAMLFVFLSCFVLAALGNANDLWASLTFTLAILSVCTSAVAASVRKDRAAWAGFALAGWAALLVWLLTSQAVGDIDGHPRPFFALLAAHFRPQLNPAASGGSPLIHYRHVSQALDVMLTGFAGSLLARFIARADRADQR